MQSRKYVLIILICLFVSAGWGFSQNNPPVISNTELDFDVRENDFAKVKVFASDQDGDNMTFTFDVVSSHTLALEVTEVTTDSNANVSNRFPVPEGSFNTVIRLRVTVSDGVDSSSQTFNFSVVSINTRPVLEIVVSSGTGDGTIGNPVVSPGGIGLSLNISDADSYENYGYFWDVTKENGLFCSGYSMTLFGADIAEANLVVGRLSTGAKFVVEQNLIDGVHVVHVERDVWVDPAPDGCSPSAGLSGVSLSTNLSGNQASPGQNFLAIGSAESSSSVSFTFFSSTTGTKPAQGFYSTTKSACSNGCTAQANAVAYSSGNMYLWLDASSDGDSETKSLVVTIGDGGGGTSPPPPGCSGSSPNSCANCGSMEAPTVDAGCPETQIVGGSDFELVGDVDHPLMGIALFNAEWQITNYAGLSESSLWIEAPNDVNDAILHTPEVDASTTVTVRLDATVGGCGCFDTANIVLLPVQDPGGGGSTGADVKVMAPASVDAGIGESFDYSVTVTNLGPDQATGVTLTQTVPAGISYASASPSICSLQGSDVVCSVGILASAQNYVIGFVFNADQAGTVNPSLSVSANETDPAPTNNSQGFSVQVNAVADLVLSPLEDSRAVKIGQETELEFEVENVGPAPSTNVVFAMSLPQGASVVSSDPTCQVGEAVVCTLGTLEPDGSISQRVTLSLSEEGTFNSVFSVTGDEFDPDDEDNNGSITFVVSEAAQLVFPHSLNVDTPFPPNRYIGIAVFNPGTVPTDVEFIAFDAEGKELGRSMLSELEGRSLIPPKGQSAMLTGEILEGSEIASIIAQGTNGPVELFFMLGDYNLTSLDGVAGPLVEGQRLYFQIARSNASEATVLFLFNSDPENPVEIGFELRDAGGSLISEASRTLIAQGSLAEEIGSLFGLDVIDGSVKIVADRVVKGFEVYSHGQGISALSAQQGMKVTRLVSPHYFATHGGNTAVWLHNVGQNWADIVIKAYKDDGSFVGEHAFRLLKDERFVKSVTEFLPVEINGSDVASGYCIVEVEGGPVGIFPTDATVIGSITFTAFDGQTIATLPLTQVGSKESRFLHVAQSDVLSMYTGLAILNLSGNPANVNVSVFDQGGNVVAQKTLETLADGARIVDILSGATFFQTEFEQVGGHIEIISDEPVFIFALFGDYGGKFLSAIEGQTE